MGLTIWPGLGLVYLAMGHHGPLILAKFLRFRLGRAKPFKNHGMLLFQMEYLSRLVHSINISPTFGPVLLINYITRLIRCYCYVLSDYQNSHVLWGFYLIKTSQNVWQNVTIAPDQPNYKYLLIQIYLLNIVKMKNIP